MHLSQRALLRMPRRCTQRDLRTVRQRVMPYFPQGTIVKSTRGRNRAAAHVPLQSIVQNAISMAHVIGKPPPSGVAIVVILVDATSLWKASSTNADVWVNVWGGTKYASKVKLWASWFCMDGGDELIGFFEKPGHLRQPQPRGEGCGGGRCPLSKPIFELHCYFDGGWEGDASNGGGLGLSVGCAKTPMVLLSKWGWSPPQDGGHF